MNYSVISSVYSYRTEVVEMPSLGLVVLIILAGDNVEGVPSKFGSKNPTRLTLSF
jgi:hypothetical protein